MLSEVRSAPRSCAYQRLLAGTSRTAISGCGLTLTLFDLARFVVSFFADGMQHSSYRVTARQGAHDLDVGEAQEVVARADLHACSRCRPPRMRGAWGPALVL